MSSAAPAVPQKTRWGILACGKISHDFVNAIRHLPDVEVVACAARSKDSAQEFAKKFNIGTAYGSYAELVQDPKVDIVYVGSLHPQHSEHAQLAMRAKKNVLVEKPFAMNQRQAEATVKVAKDNGVFLMEGMWSRYVPSMVKVRELIASGLIGKPRMVEASFGFKMPSPDQAPRLWKNEHGGGAMLDLGIYPIALANMVFGQGGARVPTRITAVGDLSEDGERVDCHESITLQYGHGETAVLNCSMLAELPNTAFITGEKGIIVCHPTWHSTEQLSYKLHGSKDHTILHFPDAPRSDSYPNEFEGSQLLKYEAIEAMRCVRAGEKESKVWSWNESIAVTKIMDECRKQIGVVYAEDKQ